MANYSIGVIVNEQSTLPSYTAVSAAVKTIAHYLIAKMVEKLLLILENFRGAVSIDGVILKGHIRHYIDCRIFQLTLL